ncbi:Predicted dehydrogenase [Verrucomicrobium sp. GAS474]|uniref:Gfo/Idh/MocA family protein n=1 Tax=Verrucomicrobium sp. GAS474 TaxID=1882831 RepID=UPI00087955B3|nr:Gfo/Idh/MocA family oxidoreductase [Verrucomicrobium sp. GAS474]SDT98769.1 Predicted dehydrogenase [Verrucomicrobium sp. GAS474]
MSKKPLRIAIIGYNFMGKAHSNGWLQARRFFDLDVEPVLQVACGRDEAAVRAFADRWGWKHVETDWRKAVERDDVDVVDISLPQHLHHDVAVAAARAGKHLFCEKPMALSLSDAEEMLAAARKAGVKHYVNHNYRRCPAVRLARQLIDEGRIGRIFHWRGSYQQDWIVDPAFPLTWHLKKETAGSGPHGDLNSHSVDLAHYLVGDIRRVSCLTTRFIDERPLPGAGAATFSAGTGAGPVEMGKVTVEDASLMMAEFASGAVGSFEATRFAPGRKNRNAFEIYGSEGSLAFDLERMNELQYFSRRDPGHAQGFRTILATEASHPYIANWWPPGHIIGYEHGFAHAAADFAQAVARDLPIDPDFSDGVKCIRVLEAGLKSAAEGRAVETGAGK